MAAALLENARRIIGSAMITAAATATTTKPDANTRYRQKCSFNQALSCALALACLASIANNGYQTGLKWRDQSSNTVALDTAPIIRPSVIDTTWIRYSEFPNLHRRNGIANVSIPPEKRQGPLSTVDRIYYINMEKNPQRRDFMESWLSKQSIPYERFRGRRGDRDVCIESKNWDKYRCIGISGLAKTNIGVMDTLNTTGITLILEDDFYISPANMNRLLQSVAMVPNDWDIIRWDCHGFIPPTFPWINDYVFQASYNDIDGCNQTDGATCWFCGGTHAMLWRDSSIDKLRASFDQRPYNDIDCRLVDDTNLVGYCVQNNVVEIHHPQGEVSNIPINWPLVLLREAAQAAKGKAATVARGGNMP
jgi:hypothetical protein